MLYFNVANSRIQKLGEYLRPHWQQVILGIVSLFLVNAVGISIPLLIRDTIDQLREEFDFSELIRYVIILFLLASLMWVIRMSSRLLLFGIGRSVEFDLKQKIFQHLLNLEPGYFSTNTSGDLINRATSDVDNIRRLVGFALLSLVNTAFAYALTLPTMLAIHGRLSLVAISVYPLMLITVQLFSKKLQIQQFEVQEKLSQISQLVQEDMSGIALIKIYAQESSEREAFSQQNQELLTANLKLARIRNFLFPLIQGIAFLSLLILLWLGVPEIEKGLISIGDFIALIIFVERLVFPTALLGFTITAYQRGEVSVDRIEAIFTTEPKVKNFPNAIDLPLEKIQGEIKADGLTYYYPESEIPALKNVNFIIKPGETVAIVGPIGCGKSTLANSIPRLIDIKPGQLFIDGYDITKLKLDSLRSAIAYVPQDSFLFSSTIKDNIRYGDPLKEESEVESVAKIASIHPEIINFPQQYDTIVGERGITLSGGQRQRTSLARALLLNAPILILDDALSSVDNQTATGILDNLSNKSGKTVIFISHQMSAAATADRILVMDRGEIVQIGTHYELLESPGLYNTLWKQHKLEEVLK